MSRADRRKAGNKEKVKTYVLTEAQIEDIRRKAVEDDAGKLAKKLKDEATELAMAYLMSIPIMVLRDKFGFGRIRIDRFVGFARTWIKAANADPETLRELVQLAYDETGYEVDGFKYQKQEAANEH